MVWPRPSWLNKERSKRHTGDPPIQDIDTGGKKNPAADDERRSSSFNVYMSYTLNSLIFENHTNTFLPYQIVLLFQLDLSASPVIAAKKARPMETSELGTKVKTYKICQFKYAVTNFI